MEYRLRWVPTQNSGVDHVHFMFFVLISFVLGSRRKPSFQWNMGFIGMCINMSHFVLIIAILLNIISLAIYFNVNSLGREGGGGYLVGGWGSGGGILSSVDGNSYWDVYQYGPLCVGFIAQCIYSASYVLIGYI